MKELNMSRHVACLADRETCDQLVLKELRSRGLQPKMETPKPAKRSLVPFSTPGSSNTPAQQGLVFGKRLTDLSTLFVEVDENTDLFVPKFMVNACQYIEEHLNSVGIYRLAGSAARQKNIRKELETTEVDLDRVDPSPSVLDVASLLKQFLRELPVPVIPTYLHSVLVEALNKDESSLLLCLLLLPSLHLSCLSYLARHLANMASNSEVNKMNASNLAIVLTPSLFPMQDKLVSKDKKMSSVPPPDQELKLHTAIVEFIIKNASKIGYLPENLFEKYNAAISNRGYSTSEDNLDEDCLGPSERKAKKRQRRRSGSLSRVLSVVNKGIRAMARSNTPSRSSASTTHDYTTPSIFSQTPDHSPRKYSTKRKASGEHKQSPTNKSQKRTFESTFTPKMRTRTFSMKKFKRKKSEMKQQQQKESFTVHADLAFTPNLRARVVAGMRVSPRLQSVSASPSVSTNTFDNSSTINLSGTQEKMEEEQFDSQNSTYTSSQFENDYAEVKAEYQQLKAETKRLEAGLRIQEDNHNSDLDLESVEERYKAALANGTLTTEPRQAAKKLDQVKRRSNEGKKPRSPSQRRIGAIRRRSSEKERRESSSVSPKERGRSTLPKYTVNKASPNTKVPLTPRLGDSEIKGRLARGRPNSTSSGLEKPSASPVMMTGPNGKVVVRQSFKKERPEIGTPLRQPNRQNPESPMSPSNIETRSMTRQSESLQRLRQDIKELIEQSFGREGQDSESAMDEDVFVDSVDGGFNEDSRLDVGEIANKMANVSFGRLIEMQANSVSPMTRSQLRRQSSAFEFAKPDSVPQQRENLRRQSSAFEFRTGGPVEPIYENLSRDVSSRASLRRRNSSVKDLIQKMEAEAKRRIGSLPSFEAKSSARKPSRISEEPPLYANLDDIEQEPFRQTRTVSEPVPSISTREQVLETNLDENEPVTPHKDEEEWMDGAEFFNNILPVPNKIPQCGRSSIVKIRKENRGRVLDSVNKFSNMTPVRGGGGGRPSNAARMGVCASPALHPPPISSRRQTLTGIRTSYGGPGNGPVQKNLLLPPPTPGRTPRKSLAPHTPGGRKSLAPQTPGGRKSLAPQHHRESDKHYAAPTTASLNRTRDKSPSTNTLKPTMKPRKSPSYNTNVIKKKRSPNVATKQSIIHKQVAQDRSDGKQQAVVKRSASNGVTKNKTVVKIKDRRKDKRFLTIGYADEIRSPLKECQNIHANIKRSNSDQTSSSKPVKPRYPSEAHEVLTAQVTRTRSLKTESPALPADRYMTPGAERVRRAHSDRSTPRKHSHRTRLELKAGGHMHRIDANTPRKSPRLNHLI